MAMKKITELRGTSVRDAVQPSPGRVAFALSDGTMTNPVQLPPGPQGRDGANVLPTDDAVAQAITDTSSATSASLGASISDRVATALVKLTSLPIPDFPIPTVITSGVGGYTATVDHEAMHDRGAGLTMYVDPVNGSNSNDGLSWATAKADPTSAAMADSSVAEVIVRGGVYTRAQSNVPVGIEAGRSHIAFRAEPGTRPVLTQCDTSSSWTVQSGAVYATTINGTGMVLDRSVLTADGLPMVLSAVSSVAEAEATPGSAYHDGTAQYVHLHDGRTPDGDVLVSRSTYHLNTTIADPGEPMRILLDGIEFWGGLSTRTKAWRAGDQLVARNCAWRYAADNGLSVQGIERVVLVGCEATHNGVDGLNYHAVGDLSGYVLEIDCVGSHNGQKAGATSCNGSTAHETYRVVRVGGIYESNPGPNVADVNFVQSANYGVVARNALGYGGTPDYDFTAPELEGGRLWLIGCRSGSDLALRNAGNAEVFNFRAQGQMQGGVPVSYL